MVKRSRDGRVLLRWHAQVRTLNGGITTYVRVRAANACEAAERARVSAYKRHKDNRDHFRQYKLDDWYTIYVGLHSEDHNSISQAV